MSHERMISVKLSTLEKALRDAGLVRFATDSHVEELRTLLDAPAYPNRLCHIDYTAHPYRCGCLKGDEEAQRRFDEHQGKVAQHQVDTVPVSAHWTDWSMVTLEIGGQHRTYVECGKPEGVPVAYDPAKENKQFEAWARTQSQVDLRLCDIGLYYERQTGLAHDAWQHRAKLYADQPAPVAVVPKSECPNCLGDAMFGCDACIPSNPTPVAVVPDGYCIMPRRLTAENGAKALLLGEFKLEVTKECSECCELEEPTEGCEICDGEGEYGQQYTISWDQIKFIYSKAVSGLALRNDSK